MLDKVSNSLLSLRQYPESNTVSSPHKLEVRIWRGEEVEEEVEMEEVEVKWKRRWKRRDGGGKQNSMWT